MNRIATTVLTAVLLATPMAKAQDAAPEAPTPQHEWLKQFVGKWDAQAEVVFDPNEKPVTLKGTLTARMIGGLWMVAEGDSKIGEMSVQSVLTLGYDPQKQRFIGTWVDSMHNHLWTYEGQLDETGKVLTLKTEGPDPSTPGQTATYKEVIEFKSKDHYVFSSAIQTEQDQWHTFITVDYRRRGDE